jgi:hypothetical protein
MKIEFLRLQNGIREEFFCLGNILVKIVSFLHKCQYSTGVHYALKEQLSKSLGSQNYLFGPKMSNTKNQKKSIKDRS